VKPCQRRFEDRASALRDGQNGVWHKENRCASEHSMRTCTHHTPWGASLAHDVSVRGGLAGRAFGSVSTISIAPPHSEQVGCHSSWAVDAAVGSASIVDIEVDRNDWRRLGRFRGHPDRH
jgi:hypothetical protein